MTNLDLVRTSDQSVVGTVTLRDDGTVTTTEGAASAVWRSMRRLATSDRQMFEQLATHGWSNGYVSFRSPEGGA